MIILVYIFVGVVAGLTAGLFGVGGGLVVVPALIFAFASVGVSAEVLTHMAIGTSLATIVVNAIASAYTHHKHGAVSWRLVIILLPGLLLGVPLGGIAADLLAGSVLQLSFGVFLLLMAVKMGFGFVPSASRELPMRVVLLFVSGLIGGISALFGIGGGSMTVPFLLWCNVPMRKAVAVSAACGIPIAVVGAVTAMFTGWDEPALPKWSLGYVYLPAFAGIVFVSGFFARQGALLAHRLPALLLQKLFAAFLFALGLQFVIRNVSL